MQTPASVIKQFMSFSPGHSTHLPQLYIGLALINSPQMEKHISSVIYCPSHKYIANLFDVKEYNRC